VPINLLRSENSMACLCFGLFVALGCLVKPESAGVSSIRNFPFAYLAPFVSPIVFFAVFATNRKWRRDYEISKYLKRRSIGTVNRWPRRLPWLSVIAGAYFLFFLPLASQMFTPFSDFSQHRMQIPWNYLRLTSLIGWHGDIEGVWCLVPESKWGMTPNPFDWTRPAYRTSMDFRSYRRTAVQSEFEQKRGTDHSFDIGSGHILTCAESWRQGYVSVSCRAPVNARGWDFWAYFLGDPQDLPMFYKILEGSTGR